VELFGVRLIDPGQDLGQAHLVDAARQIEEERFAPLGERIPVDLLGCGIGIQFLSFTS